MAKKIKFLMDEHIHPAVTRGLRQRGVEVLTAQEVGLCQTDDKSILAYALSKAMSSSRRMLIF